MAKTNHKQPLALAFLVLLLATLATAATNLTLHNLCAHPVWPLVTPNSGLPAIADAARLDGHGEGLVTLTFPPAAWSGRVVARTGCSGGGAASPVKCETGDAPPVTVAQVSVHGPRGLAEYSVSLVDGFNVAAVITPHGFEQGRECPALGCAADLAVDCPADAKAPGGGCMAVAGQAEVFKARCPDTRTTPTDVEATPQRCLEPGELKVVFCPTAGDHLDLGLTN
ncbi:osmotin-like protein [Oryza brachyantha]|uniref:osmotin-like protein n=1 Tax=Oryza brachyantha TaxID=4533 RepID=UPI001ADBEF1C|nr:osmotin-like protein [Oryza brachyantha]